LNRIFQVREKVCELSLSLQGNGKNIAFDFQEEISRLFSISDEVVGKKKVKKKIKHNYSNFFK